MKVAFAMEKKWCLQWNKGKHISVMYLFSLSHPLSSMLSSLIIWLELLRKFGETLLLACVSLLQRNVFLLSHCKLNKRYFLANNMQPNEEKDRTVPGSFVSTGLSVPRKDVWVSPIQGVDEFSLPLSFQVFCYSEALQTLSIPTLER